MTAAAVLIGDIGGTNTRLAIANSGTAGEIQRYVNADVDGIGSCLSDFLSRRDLAAAQCDLMLAVAAPVVGDSVTLTNLAWDISRPHLHTRFGFRRIRLVNDFFAIAQALPALTPSDTLAIGGGIAVGDAPALVIGPGTGFGASIALPGGATLATEAGHALMSATTAAEVTVLGRLRETLGVVSVEQVLSGAGLSNLHRAIAGQMQDRGLSAEAIATRAGAGDDPAATDALALFFAFLGIAARNLALSIGARGGVYLAGGILPRHAQALAASDFRARFEFPAPLPGYLEGIPTRLITHPEPALLGLACHANGATNHGSAD
jgi:glucokinase